MNSCDWAHPGFWENMWCEYGLVGSALILVLYFWLTVAIIAVIASPFVFLYGLFFGGKK